MHLLMFLLPTAVSTDIELYYFIYIIVFVPVSVLAGMHVVKKSKEALIERLVQEAAMTEEEQVVGYIYLMDAGGDIRRREH